MEQSSPKGRWKYWRWYIISINQMYTQKVNFAVTPLRKILVDITRLRRKPRSSLFPPRTQFLAVTYVSFGNHTLDLTNEHQNSFRWNGHDFKTLISFVGSSPIGCQHYSSQVVTYQSNITYQISHITNHTPTHIKKTKTKDKRQKPNAFMSSKLCCLSEKEYTLQNLLSHSR